MATLRVFWRRDRVLKSGTFQSRPTNRSRLSTNPVVWRRGIPNNTFIVRQTCIAASLNSGCRPRLPVGAACQVISGSNQIDSEPRCFSAVLYEGQFLVLYVVRDQLLMFASYHAGFAQGIPHPICATKPFETSKSVAPIVLEMLILVGNFLNV